MKNNSLYFSLLFLSLLFISCSSEKYKKNLSNLSFNEINIRHLDPKGYLKIEVKSPYAVQDQNTSNITTKDISVRIYINNEPRYTIKSDKSLIKENGKYILLENNAFIKDIKRSNITS